MTAEQFIAAGSRLYGSYGWQAELAKTLGMNKATIHRYAKGKLDVPLRVEVTMKALEAAR